MDLNPTPTQVSTWLKTVDRDKLQTHGWVEINRHFHGIAMAMRPYLQQRFPETADQEAAFDGLTLGLLTIIHFETIEQLAQLLAQENGQCETEAILPEPIKPTQTPLNESSQDDTP
ncbi:MAG TPA: hypothetical protein VLI54_04775 [Bacillota bacterium]|nr:hypothetical protein [Bacillota bacterium]